MVKTGTVDGIAVKVMRDNGSTGCVVRESLVDPSQFTGGSVNISMIDGSAITCPVVMVNVESPFFSGRIHAAAMKAPLFDLIIGNIAGVVDPCACNKVTQDCSEQKGCAVITRSQAKTGRPQAPLHVLPVEGGLLNTADLAAEQNSDPSLENVRKKAAAGETMTNKCGGTTRFILKRGKLYRETITLHGETQTQLVVPHKYRPDVMRLGHCAALGGHMGRGKTQNRISSQFFWPGVNGDIARFVKSCDVCQKTADKGRVRPAPLQPLPLISQPFERVAVDIVGPIMP